MIWILLFLLAVFGYYFVLKSDAKTSAKICSLLSGSLFILALTPMWNFSLFTIYISISLFLPFVIGILGGILAWFGVKEAVRGSLVFAHGLVLFFYLLVYLMGRFSLQQA